jgi:hypothetical protein
LAALKIFTAPVLGAATKKSPDMLSSQLTAEIPVYIDEKLILTFLSSVPYKQILPHCCSAKNTSSPGLNMMSVIATLS